jgi:glycosyltransferase involved in cell wall biosynthesis
MKQPILTILIPVLNEEKTVKKILNEVSKLRIDNYEIIIVDDGSKDKSYEVITDFMKNFKSNNIQISIIRHETNRGKGAGIKSGLSKARGEYFIIQDADLEYLPRDITPLIEHAVANKADAVYGSRFKGKIKNMPKPNYYANRFYNFMVRRMYGVKITDMHTCYKMVKTDLLKELNMTSEGFGYAPELVSKLLIRKVKIHELPVSFNGRTKKQGKKINYVDGIVCVRDLLKYRLKW